jgi:hypothetical protein
MGEGRAMIINRKHVTETRKYEWDFTDILPSGVTLSSITSITQEEVDGDTGEHATSTDLTIASQSLATPIASALVSGGVAGKLYVLKCLAAASDSQAPVVAGGLLVDGVVG